MFKKITQFFSRTEPSRSNTTEKVAHDLIEPIKSAEEFKESGDRYFKSGSFSQADKHYKQSLGVDSGQFEIYKNLGVICYYQGRLEGAIKYYDQAIALKPDFSEAYSNRGLALNDLGRLDEALVNLDYALELKPDFAFAYNNRGIVLRNLNRLDEAIASFDRAIELKAGYAEAYNNRGSALYRSLKLKEALADYDRAIGLMPNYVEAISNRGIALNYLGQPEKALESLDLAISLKPDSASAHHNRGVALKCLNRHQDAVLSYDRAIALQADFAEAYNNRGSVLYNLMRLKESLVNYERAIALKPDFAEAYNNQAATLSDLNRLDEALAAYELAIKFAPDNELFFGSRFEIKIKLCEWSGYAESLKELEQKIRLHKQNASHPFIVMALFESAAVQKQAAEVFVHEKFSPNDALAPINKNPKHDKIRIAYFSADFRNHAVAYLTAGLFEKHDKSKFELIAFSLVSGPIDDMRKRIEPVFDSFVDVSKCSDREVALKARDMGVDIAIDLGGFTSHCRAGIFALRAAPVQVNYIGYPGTMGADYIDYIIADSTVIPQSHRKFYTEKIAYLPSFQVNDSKRVVSDRKFSREELGLPATGFVFCSFNNIYKITPSVFDGWMRILKQVDGSVLWLLEDCSSTVKNLIKEAELRGVKGERLIFAKRLSASEYLARYRMADLFLDTLPYNAGTTASDALWTGLPVLTQAGEAFAGRMAASLLNAIHLPELITSTQDEYVALAVELAMNPYKMAKIKQKLTDNRLTTPLFDIDYFTKHIESAYTQMYERYQAGLTPDHIATI